MQHLIICWRRENSRNVQGIQVRVLLILMRCLLQSNSNYPSGGVKSLGSSTISIIAWEYEKPMKFQFSQSGDDQQYMCLHVSKMASLDAKVAFNNCNFFHSLVQWNGTRLTWALSYPDHCLFLVYKRRKKQMISRIDQQWPKSVLRQITVTHPANHNRPLENRFNPFELNLCHLHLSSILQVVNELPRRQCSSSMSIMA